jgi:arylsulfatase A-like enzyme
LDSIQLPPGYKESDLDDVPAEGQRIARNRYFPHIQKHQQWKQGIQAYLASIHYADAMVGRVLDALESSPHRDNTIVVLWSDHGWHLGEKEHWQKFTGWRVSTRVPLIVRAPKGTAGLPSGTVPGGVCDSAVNLVDLFATLTDLCGLPPKPDIESRSLVPLLRDPAAPWPHAAITHLDHPRNYAISTQRWRYIHYRDGGEELYDIEMDPHEWTNLAAKPAHAAKLAELRALAPRQIAPVHETQPGINNFTADLEIEPGKDPAVPSSKASTAPVTLLVSNKRQQAVRLVWIDETGKRHRPIAVQGASRWLLQTFSDHAWLILDENDEPLGHIVAPDKAARVIIQ